jgi:hypothetical protein
MTDNEVATKAPESDVQETSTPAEAQSIIPGDTKAQDGPSMGVCSYEYPLTMHAETPRNTVQQIGLRVCPLSIHILD